MKRLLSLLRISIGVLVGTACVVLPLSAGDGVPYPKIPSVPKAKGEQCVEPTDIMRRNHMEFILHQRDETTHRGIRTKKHSLNGCIDCHVTADANGDYPRVTSEEHFCASCHRYTGVKIDCFDCHRDRPEQAGTTPHR